MSDIKDMIADGVNRLFAGIVNRDVLDAAESGAWQAGLWQAVTESGYADVLGGETEDELAGKWADAFPVFHAIGFHRLPLPLSETIIARALLRRAGLAVPAGEAPLSVIQQQAGDGLALELGAGALSLNGTVQAVPWASAAAALVVAGRIGDRQVLAVVDTKAPGVTLRCGINVAREPRDEVIFQHARCDAFVFCDQLPTAPVTLYGGLARAAMMAGAVESILRESVQYANDRVQFGRSIGKFQAIQQALAALAGEVTSAQTVALAACEAAASSPRAFSVAVAKIRTGQAAGLAASIGHQVHGAIGYTYEHSLHYATRRLWSWRAEFGSEAEWAKQLGRDAIARGSANFWSDLTERGNAANR
ncbi:acyl-CoA dehydrogenase family protein [Undibacterium sp. TJN25]|uniref:acyl-CoA dehydrogenase family protein n=1 Tax=Undibacterium sp. TJN25 TaxID=3413056 RepID=UPI003BF16DAA